jgi:hypothetical protein
MVTNVEDIVDMRDMENTDRDQINDGAVAYNYSVAMSPAALPDPVRDKIMACVRKADWDGEGADEITVQTCRAAVAFLECVLERNPQIPTPQVSPSVLGSVTLYWHCDNSHLIVRIHAGTSSVFYQSELPGNVRAHGDEPFHEVVQKVVRLFGLPHAS